MSHHMEFTRLRLERRRRGILYYLRQEPDWQLSLQLLALALEGGLEAVTHDVMLEDINHLHTHGLVTLPHIGSLPAVKLTATGAEAALGKRVVPGVQSEPFQ